jgi:hypothetical protein
VARERSSSRDAAVTTTAWPTAGAVKIPRGRWYLGLDRDAHGAWTLTMAYGDRALAEIPANSTLVFVVNLIDVKK